MYHNAYQDVIEAAPSEARNSERKALLNAAMLLDAAIVAGPRSIESVTALLYVRRLWTYFVEQLAQPGNPLSKETRAKLISIGLWILGEEERIRMGQSSDYASIAEVCRTIAAGLSS
jgi:flagellar biosynthesis activator protein FlaF